MAFVKVCSVAEVGEMTARYLMDEGVEVLVARDRAGKLHAINGTCPHQDYPLIEGSFDGSTITCSAHGWIIDVTTGKGLNPSTCSVDYYPIKIENDEVWVDPDAA